MTSDESTTLSADQESRLHILRQISEMTTSSAGIGSKTRVPVASLLTLADWVMSGEPAHFTLASPFGQMLADAEQERPDTASTTGHAEQIIVHSIEEDGLPDMSMLKGQVAFIYEGAIISGYPGEVSDALGQIWVAMESITPLGDKYKFSNITHWVEFPVSIWELTR